jgi:hypothetical protein
MFRLRLRIRTHSRVPLLLLAILRPAPAGFMVLDPRRRAVFVAAGKATGVVRRNTFPALDAQSREFAVKIVL